MKTVFYTQILNKSLIPFALSCAKSRHTNFVIKGKKHPKKGGYKMTSNQLTLGRLREDTRHNKVTENLGFQTLGETKRHNLASEDIGYQNVSLGYATLGETKRHNIASEGIQSSLVSSQVAKNLSDAKYTNTKSDNYLKELYIKRKDAQTNLLNAKTKQEELKLKQEIAEYDKLLKTAQTTESLVKGMGGVASILLSTM